MPPPPTRHPTKKPAVQVDEGVLLKMDNIDTPPPSPGEELPAKAMAGPDPIAPEPTSKPTRVPTKMPTPKPTPSPAFGEVELDPALETDTGLEEPPKEVVKYDAFGNQVEFAPPPPGQRPPGRPARPPRPASPAVAVNNVQEWQYWDGPNGQTLPGQPGRPGQVPLMGGVVNTQCGCCGCCGGCGGSGASGGGTTYNLVLPSGEEFQQILKILAGGDTTKSIAAAASAVEPGFTMAPSLMNQPECPWSCFIDENVPTHGKSNQDDAIYEIFYSNPLNCCGTIVEVGAGEGITDSASYFFEMGMNWTSILTEADPQKYNKLVLNRNGKKARTLNGAFCKDGPYTLYNEGRFKPLGDDIISEAVSMDVPDTAQNVQCIRLDKDVLAGVNHVNVMMVHVGGDPWAVLSTMDWKVTVDIWVIELDETQGMSHATLRAALKMHDYVPAKWDITLWCDSPNNCMPNEVWLRKGFNPISKQMLNAGLRGSVS